MRRIGAGLASGRVARLLARLGGRLAVPALLPALGLVVLAPSGAAAEPMPLPAPASGQAQDTALCRAVGCAPDRLLRSTVPGPVRNDERVVVALQGGGAPARVQLEQRLTLTGRGDYQVRERGPARQAESLGELDPPVTKLGAVVWQGFSPGRRELAARLLLDPVLEAPRLPLAVTASFLPGPGDGPPTPLGAGGRLPGAGTVVLRLQNRTGQPAVLPRATDVAATTVAALLDRLRARAAAAPGPRLPAAGAGLPATIEASEVSQAQGSRSVPLRVSGTLRLAGTTGRITGPGTAAASGSGAGIGAGTGTGTSTTVAGTLAGGAAVELRVSADGPGTLEVDLTAVPVLDGRLLRPPGGARSWSAWAATGPTQRARTAALDTLVAAAATGARAASYSPYLGAELPGTGTTRFRFSFAPAPTAVAAPSPLRPRPAALALTGLATVVLGLGATLLWRRS